MVTEESGHDHAPREPADLVAGALEDLAWTLDRARFRLPLPGNEEREARRVELLIAIRRYLLPRMQESDAPLVAALVGPTGAGKSTVLNALAQQEASATGPLRPTTINPLIWAHRSHAARYWQEFVTAVQQKVGREVETVLGDDPLLHSLTLVDSPSFEVERDDGGPATDDVLAVADMCVFVTSAGRYADADSWDLAKTAQQRGLPTLFVVNRLPPGSAQVVLQHYAELLAAEGLLSAADPSLIFPITEQQAGSPGVLPPGSVAALRAELTQLADRELAVSMARQAKRGAIDDVVSRARALATGLATEADVGHRLLDLVEQAYERQAGRLSEEFAQGRFSYLANETWNATTAQLAGVVTRLAGLAAQEAAARWEEDPIGRRLLAVDGGDRLWRHGAETRRAAELQLQGWATAVEQLSVELPKQRRLGRRRRRKVGRMLRAAALDPAGATPAELVLRFGAEQAELLLRWSQPTLVGDLRAALSVDASRFAAAVGDPAAMDEVPGQLSEAATRLEVAAEGLEA